MSSAESFSPCFVEHLNVLRSDAKSRYIAGAISHLVKIEESVIIIASKKKSSIKLYCLL